MHQSNHFLHPLPLITFGLLLITNAKYASVSRCRMHIRPKNNVSSPSLTINCTSGPCVPQHLFLRCLLPCKCNFWFWHGSFRFYLLIFLEKLALIMTYAHSSQALVFKPRATGKKPQYLVDPVFSRCNFEGAQTYPFLMIVPKTPLISNILLKRF